MLTSNELASCCFESYDPRSNTWDSSTEMAIPRYNFGVSVLENFLYAVGGVGRNDIILSSVEMYNFRTQKWTFVNSLPAPKASMACSGWRGSLYCLGGEVGANNSVQTAEVLKFDPSCEKWITLMSFNHPRIYPYVIPL